MGVKKIEAFPNQNIDYLWVKNGTANQALIDSTLVAGFIPTFDNGTLALANYNDNTLGAGTILNIPVDVTFWNVFRRRGGVLQQVGKFDVGVTSIHDYNVANSFEYDYLIFPETVDLAGSPITSNLVTADWWNWSIASYNEPEEGTNYSIIDEQWLLDLDLSSSNINQNVNRNTYGGFTKFPKVSIGKMNYLTGTISALLGDVDCSTYQYSDTVEMQQAFRDFISNGKKKILRSRKGNIIICETMSNNFDIADRFQEQQTRVSFSVTEIDEESNVSVIAFDEQAPSNILGGDGSFLSGGDGEPIE
jgi:hypothetical protein